MERDDSGNRPDDTEEVHKVRLREADQLSTAFGEAADGECAFCGSEGTVWPMGGGQYCSSACALQGLPEGEWTNFEEYLGDLRLKANLLDVYDAREQLGAVRDG